MFKKKVTNKEFDGFMNILVLQQMILYNTLNIFDKTTHIAYNGNLFVGSFTDLILNADKIIKGEY